jgi:hypothetical protein
MNHPPYLREWDNLDVLQQNAVLHRLQQIDCCQKPGCNGRLPTRSLFSLSCSRIETLRTSKCFFKLLRVYMCFHGTLNFTYINVVRNTSNTQLLSRKGSRGQRTRERESVNVLITTIISIRS